MVHAVQHNIVPLTFVMIAQSLIAQHAMLLLVQHVQVITLFKVLELHVLVLVIHLKAQQAFAHNVHHFVFLVQEQQFHVVLAKVMEEILTLHISYNLVLQLVPLHVQQGNGKRQPLLEILAKHVQLVHS